jgi:hypothetical protein
MTGVPAVMLSAGYLGRDSAFPVVMDFSRPWAKLFTQFQGTSLALKSAPRGWLPSPPRDVALIAFGAGRYPGFVVQEPHPDWSGYDRLSFTVYSEMKEPVSLFVRIDDAHQNNRYTDRFNRRLGIRPGLNALSIPLAEVRDSPRGRKMQLTRIRRVAFFAVQPPAPFALYFDSLKLER